MKLDRGEIICEQPAKKLRDFLGSARDGAFSNDDACDTAVLNKIADSYFGSNAKAVLAELFKRGWMVKGKRDGRDSEPRKVAIVSLTNRVNGRGPLRCKNDSLALLAKRSLPSCLNGPEPLTREMICSAEFWSFGYSAVCSIRKRRRSAMSMSLSRSTAKSRHQARNGPIGISSERKRVGAICNILTSFFTAAKK